MDKIKVLILSGEVWQDGTNGGNVLTGMFSDSDFEFAQVYCNPGSPQNNICKKYYQMTDGMVLRSFITHKPIGRSFVLESEIQQCNSESPEQMNKKFDKFFHKVSCNFLHFIRNVLWNLSNWKNDKLKNFINEFNPDIIFAPCYGNKFMCRLTRFTQKITNKKVISYISDDSYSLKQISFSIFYWINRFSVRRQLRKTFPYYSLCYTMTERQKEQCEKNFKANMKILLKPVDVINDIEKTEVNDPIKIVYAGGIYLNRWKTLKSLSDAIREINKDAKRFILNIYTGNSISKKISEILNDKSNSEIFDKVSSRELFEIYSKSDIALHVESFDLKNRLAVRMSFSTKITDCLSSGCAVMAICDNKQGGFEYLKKNDLAICIENKKDIKSKLNEILENKNVILDYSKKAIYFAKEKHNSSLIREEIKKDFESVLEDESITN